MVASFHTLGKVKNYSLARGEPPEPSSRLLGEERVIADADRILAPTPAEAAQLVGLYRANPEHIRIVPPGVDHTIFFPAIGVLRVSGCTSPGFGSRSTSAAFNLTRAPTSPSERWPRPSPATRS